MFLQSDIDLETYIKYLIPKYEFDKNKIGKYVLDNSDISDEQVC